VAGAAACEPQLRIVLVKADDLEVPPEFVKFQMRELDAEKAQEFGPFSAAGIPDDNFTPLEPGTPFYIDVIGCQTGKAEECAAPVSFVARGCTAFISIGRDDPPREERIEVHRADVGAESCPPPPP
jgi:hypothetical protein